MNGNYAQVLIPSVFWPGRSSSICSCRGGMRSGSSGMFSAYSWLSGLSGRLLRILLRLLGPFSCRWDITCLLLIIPQDIAIFNRILGIALLWITAVLVARARRAKLDDATRRLGAIVESSSDAILSVTPDGL